MKCIKCQMFEAHKDNLCPACYAYGKPLDPFWQPEKWTMSQVMDPTNFDPIVPFPDVVLEFK